MPTITVDNFTGSMVPTINGPMNSGKSYWLDVNGYDPFTKPQNLTWNEAPIQIDPAAAVITDLVVAGKQRLESGIVYVYAVGSLGRVYKIQANDPATYNPNYDNPVLLTTLTINSPTFTRGGFIDFFDSTGRIYIGHDMGVTRIDFNGGNETFMGSLGFWTQNVPRPFQQFIGKLYIGNGVNIAEIDSTSTVTTYTKLSPGFPTGTQVRDTRLTPDGNYLQTVVTRSTMADITVSTPDTSVLVPTDSYTFVWNGVDIGYTSSTFYPGIILTAAMMFGQYQYTFGYDALSSSIYNPVRKLLTAMPNVISDSPLPNAIVSLGNLVQWICTISAAGNQYVLFQAYGNLSDHDGPIGFWCPLFTPATAPETDVVKCPFLQLISNIAVGSSFSGYANNVVGTPKMYYSTVEASSGTTKYKFYKWSTFPTGLGNALVGNAQALFQTQNQLFPKKVSIKEVRIYGQPWVTNNAFQIDLIGSNDSPISGGTKLFTAGTNMSIGDDRVWYNPAMEPIYSLALRITNQGIANHVINKVEIDYLDAGE